VRKASAFFTKVSAFSAKADTFLIKADTFFTKANIFSVKAYTFLIKANIFSAKADMLQTIFSLLKQNFKKDGDERRHGVIANSYQVAAWLQILTDRECFGSALLCFHSFI
jgi:hypothetical protein